MVRLSAEELVPIPKAFFKNITLGNDIIFADKSIAKNSMLIFILCASIPPKIKEPGRIELGLFGNFFLKGIDLQNISTQRIKKLEHHINNRPVLKFSYLNSDSTISKIPHCRTYHFNTAKKNRLTRSTFIWHSFKPYKVIHKL